MAAGAGQAVSRETVRSIPFQAMREVIAVSIPAFGTVVSAAFEVTSGITDRNSFDPTINPPAGNSLSCYGYFLDVFCFPTAAGHLDIQLGINGSASWRLRPADHFAYVANTLFIIQGYRIPASYCRLQLSNDTGAPAPCDYGIYVRSL